MKTKKSYLKKNKQRARARKYESQKITSNIFQLFIRFLFCFQEGPEMGTETLTELFQALDSSKRSDVLTNLSHLETTLRVLNPGDTPNTIPESSDT